MIPIPDYNYEIEKLENEINELENKMTTEKPFVFESDIHNAAENGKLSSVQYLVEIENKNVETKGISVVMALE